MHHDPEAIDDTPEDRRWRRLVDASLGGDPLSPEDAAFLAAHRGDGVATQRERELLDALRRGEPEATEAAADDALVAAAVDRFLADRAAAGQTPRPAVGRRSALVIGLGVAFAAAAAWLLLVRPPGHVPEDISSPLAAASPDAKDSRGESPHDHRDSLAARSAGPGDPVESVPVPKDIPVELRLLRGDASAGGAPLALHQPLADGPLRLGDAACVGAADLLTACAEGEAELRARGAVLAVERGRVRVEVAPAGVGIVWIEVAGVAIVSDEPGAVLIVAEPRSWQVIAQRGAHRLRDGDVERSLAEGETADSREQVVPDGGGRPKQAKPRPASDPGQLIDEAHALRGAGKYRAAAKIYRRLLREHGDTSLARTAQVALGQLSLGPLGDPRGALSAFDAYLRDAPQGALAEEALHGRVEALHRLGREQDAARAGAEFLRRFPRSRYAQDVRQRLGTG
ncbi:tetratricopeptide repeat protein [Nannocystis pusilla]|uniref:FecR protein domain-containing protein n=1 Tax=Nannocystis pusilla TaxID=889268 RepID=A0ABS7TRU5_9BACT|nr:hypothetical protein [Nannocystis pusilla]MBZ5710964.1 hypothetical protein [Nannocystis pusilla]